MNKGKEQIDPNEQSELIRKSTRAGHQKVHSSLSLYSVKGLKQKLLIRMYSEIKVILRAYFRLVSRPFLFLIVTAALEVLVFEVTFFASVRLHNNFILHQNLNILHQ